MAKIVRAYGGAIRQYLQATAPTAEQGLHLGALWVDTDDTVLYKCISLSPITFEEVGAAEESSGGGVPVAADTVGTGVNYAVTGVPGFTNNSDPAMDGFTFMMMPTAANTGTSPQLNVNGAGYASIIRNDTTSLGTINVGDIAAYTPALFSFSYNYTRWHLLSPSVPGRGFVTTSGNTSFLAGKDYNIALDATYWIPGGGGANSPGQTINLTITTTSDITLNISAGGSTVRFLNSTGTTSLVCNPGTGTAQGHFLQLTNVSYNNWVVTKYSGSPSDWTLT